MTKKTYWCIVGATIALGLATSILCPAAGAGRMAIVTIAVLLSSVLSAVAAMDIVCIRTDKGAGYPELDGEPEAPPGFFDGARGQALELREQHVRNRPRLLKTGEAGD